MKLVKLTNLRDSDPIFVNPDQIGHIYEVKEQMAYGTVKEPKHTVVGVITHNNGGFKVKETVKEIMKLIDTTKGFQ